MVNEEEYKEYRAKCAFKDALRKRIVEDVNKMTGGHEGNPIIYFRDWDWHHYDHGTFIDHDNSVNRIKDKLKNPNRVSLDDVIYYHLMQAFNVSLDDKALFLEHACLARDILSHMISVVEKEM